MKLRILGTPTTRNYIKLTEILGAAGVELTNDLEFDFILPVFDRGTKFAADIAKTAGRYFPPTSFMDKPSLEQKCVAAGIPVLPSMPLSELPSCDYEHFIIKPRYWSGSKHPNPAVYRIFRNAELPFAIGQTDMLNPDEFFVQKALINPETKETYLLFVDGAVNGAGVFHFNSIAEKWMLNPDTDDGHITHKAGIRRVSPEDKFGFRDKVMRLMQLNGVRNTPFKAQAIVDAEANTCYINDWSWGIMPYTHLHVLDPEYVVDHLMYAYDVVRTVTKPIDKTIVMHHIKFPREHYGYSEEAFDGMYAEKARQAGVRRAEQTKQESIGAVAPVYTDYYVLYGVACDSVEEGQQKLAAFQALVDGQ